MRAAVSIFTSQVRSIGLLPRARVRLALNHSDVVHRLQLNTPLTCRLQDYISGMIIPMLQFERAGCLPSSLQTICGKPP